MYKLKSLAKPYPGGYCTVTYSWSWGPAKGARKIR